MNANSLPQALTIKDWLTDAIAKLSDIGIESARLDCEIILADSIQKSRTYLHAHGEKMLDDKSKNIADARLTRRLHHEPIAYIVGYKEFYGRQFIVTPDTLIPRPGSEDIIEMLRQTLLDSNCTKTGIKLVDIGTGCGCLGITAKLEFPFLDVTLSDVSRKALAIAKQNAKKLSADVKILKTSLLNGCLDKPDIVVANLPYVDPDWKRSPETGFEPSLALFASNRGLSVIKRLVVQASKKIKSGSYLILEADPTQHDELIELAKKLSFITELRKNYVIAFVKKVSG
jgi:release factor glutamine methyltransferase